MNAPTRVRGAVSRTKREDLKMDRGVSPFVPEHKFILPVSIEIASGDVNLPL
jgi:hypothetical protein